MNGCSLFGAGNIKDGHYCRVRVSVVRGRGGRRKRKAHKADNIALLALACAWGHLKNIPRPLYPYSPAEDEDAAREWEEESEVYRKQETKALNELIRGAALNLCSKLLWKTLREIQNSEVAREHARREISKVLGDVPWGMKMHGYGPEWLLMPMIYL